MRLLLNIIWFVLGGLWPGIGHLVTAAAQATTIIGIPLAIANVKLIPGCLWPFGREIVQIDELTAAQRSDAVLFPGES